MKKIFSLLLMLCALCPSIIADDIPFRYQRRELFQLLPINEESIVFLGNSITNFNVWNEAFGSDLRVVNRGISGITSGEVLSHIDLIVSGKPAKIFIMIGVNDFATPEATIPNITRMIDIIQEESPQTQIYIQSILPTSRADRGSLIEPWNDGLKQLCQEKGVPYIDLWSKMIVSESDHGLNPEYTTDNLHMNGSGYRVWTNDFEQYTGIAPSYATTGGNQYIDGFNAVENMLLSNYCLLPIEDGDVLMLGDYNVETGEWMELLRNPKVKNRGMGIGLGYSLTLQHLNQAIPYLVKPNAGKIFISCGSKDLYNNVAPSTAAGYYNQVLTSIRSAAPNAEIYVQSVIPDASSSVNNSKMIPFNNAIKSLVEQDTSGKIHFVDIYTQLAENGALAEKFVGANTSQSKGINGRGYLRWANTIAPLIDSTIAPLPEPSDAEISMIEQLANARFFYRSIEAGEEIGQYPITSVNKLKSAIDAANTFFKNGNYTETSLIQEIDKLAAICAEVEGDLVSTPRLSTTANEHWYTLSTPLRNNHYVQSAGVGQGLIGATYTNSEAQLWKFVSRGDNTLDIINCADNSYISPSSSTNTQLYTSASQPSSGWSISPADSKKYFIITNGSVQLNQTTSDHSYKIFNWGDGDELVDVGCQFQIKYVTNAPTPDPEPEPTLTPAYTALNIVLNGSVPVRVPDEFAQAILTAPAVTVAVDYTVVNSINSHMAIATATDTTTSASFLSVLLNHADDGNVGYGVRYNDGTGCFTQKATISGRHQIVIPMTATILSLYLDGSKSRDVAESGNYSFPLVFSEITGSNALYIGGFKTSNLPNKYPFTGTIHSIRFYTKALSAEEISNLTYDNLEPSAIAAIESDELSITVIDRVINCNRPFTLYSIDGRIVPQNNLLPAGIYILHSGSQVRKILID